MSGTVIAAGGGGHVRRRPGRGRRVSRAVLLAASIAAGAGGAVTFVIRPLLHQFTGEFEDFNAYYDASRFVHAGVSPYAGFDSGPANMTMSGYDYPPVVAWAFQPIGLLPKDVGGLLWLWIGLAATVAAVLLVAITILPSRWPRIQLGILASFVYAPATYNLWHGQMTPIVLLLLAIAMRAYVDGREVRCGVILAFAAGIKVAPVVLALLLLRRRWWRGLTAMGSVGLGIAGAGVLTVGFEPTRQYMTTVLPALGRQNGWFTNESWNGAVNRAGSHAVTMLGATSIPLAAVTLALVLASLGAAAWAVGNGGRTRAERGAEFGAATAAMLLAETAAWYPHQTYLLLPLAATAALIAERRGASRRLLVAGMIAATVTVMIIGPLLIGRFPGTDLIAAYERPGGYALIQLWSLPTLGVATLLGTLARVAHERDAVPGATPMEPA